ncbi:hypothetical protein K437DRAFT_272907 [Tilletiaria anomala UBC 951]|uniref:Exocyst complex component Sec8 n=1 Tax=Tilletiaria anomala (strain ATCC 24038 / CBS 436.72 / UBC 951) TaxID=1037660 RepID=A0A066WK63_TILAU|nr:uncharacterized protein K437DRAFT_272907 [Tilletiaria anomala UBC 951]KDN51404.1 hypothetical protein K437DRAFT_272907 [Tilletiaria anomala UBC 951]
MSRQQSMRSKGAAADIRSRIRHENTNLGAGVDIQPSFRGGAALGAPHGLAGVQQGEAAFLAHGGSGYSSSAAVAMNGGGCEYSHQISASIASLSSSGFHGTSSETNLAQSLQGASLGGQTPLRPARSARRPQNQSPQRQDGFALAGPSRAHQLPGLQIHQDPVDRSAAPGRNLLNSNRGTRVSPVGEPDGYGSFSLARGASTSGQFMHNQHGYEAPQPRSGLKAAYDGEEDAYGGLSPLGEHPGHELPIPSISPTTPASVGSLTHRKEPAALNSVISALSAAGRKHQTNRIQRGAAVSAEDERRRRGSQMRIDQMRHIERRPLESYLRKDDARAFREINAVLRKVKAEWSHMTMDDFNAASFALSLMDDSSLGASFDEFEKMKKMLERALQGTLDDHYEAFASAITLHNNVLSSLSTAQNNVSVARRRLRDSRDALGAKRADLVQMWHKSQGVKEALRLLDTVENLKNMPDRLEALMSQKRFLEGVNVLTRGLRTIDKAEIVELTGTADLRAYLKAQEQSVLDILVEELHNHLYLKSPSCDVRWHAYTPGQTLMPTLDLDNQFEESEEENMVAAQDLKASLSSLPSTHQPPPAALHRFLQTLSSRPSFDPKLATDVVDTSLAPSTSTSALTGELIENTGDSGMANSKSTDSLAGLTGFNSAGDSGSNGSENIESNSFLYIEMLLESIARLDKLSYVLDTIAHRLQVEVHQVIDTTIEEVERRNEPSRQHSMGRAGSMYLGRSSSHTLSFSGPSSSAWRGSGPPSTLHVSTSGSVRHGLMRRTAAESFATAMDEETMRDLFWTLFSKFDAILQGHRAVYEVTTRISSRTGFSRSTPLARTTTLSSPVKVWRQIQLEVRSLLHDHLVDESQPSSRARRQAIISVNDVLRFGKTDRDKSKRLFTLPLGQVKSGKKEVNPIKKYEEELTAALRIHVPGLVSSDAAAGPGITMIDLGHSMTIGGTSTAELTGTGHRILVKPDAFNLSRIFKPMLKFIAKVQAVMPPDGEGTSDYDSFLEEFVRETFLPQLEEKAQLLFLQSTSSLDALQEDAAFKQATGKPVTRSVRNVLVLLDGIYSILEATPFHRTSIARLMVQLIVQFYQRCSDRFTNLVALPADGDTPSDAVHTCAAWAQRPEILEYLSDAVQSASDETRQKELFDQENRTLLQVSKYGSGLKFADLTTSRKKLLALGTLKHSLASFLVHMRRLKAMAVFPEDQLGVSLLGSGKGTHMALPLNDEMAVRFQSLPATFEYLCNVILFTLRAELRIRAAFHLNLTVTDGNYLIEEATLEPDPHVVDLNAEIVSCDDVFLDSLPNEDRQFLFAGLSGFMDLLLVASVRRLRAINRHGVTKMIRNIMALQQNLKSMVDTPEQVNLERSQRFWDLLLQTPEEMLEVIRKDGAHHTFEEYKSALHLVLGLENVRASGGAANGVLPPAIANAGTFSERRDTSRNQYNEYLIELHQVVGDA